MSKVKLLVVLLMVVLCVNCVIKPASAASTSQDGLEAVLLTDKLRYNQGEDIQTTLTVTNTNGFAVNSIVVELMLPNGYRPKTGDLFVQKAALAPGEAMTVNATFSAVSLPQTGDHSNIDLWLILLLMSIIAFAVAVGVINRNRKAYLSMILCIMLTCSIPLCRAANADKLETNGITVFQTVMIGDVSTDISAVISYADICKVEFDLNYHGASHEPTAQFINFGEKVSEPTSPTRDGYVFHGWTRNSQSIAWIDSIMDFESYYVYEDMVLYAVWESEAEDIDGDGLSYKDEAQYSTDAFLYDTDMDGLSDGDEINVYGTDPVRADTDGDTVEDGLEVKLGLDPLKQRTDDRTIDAEKIVSISFETYDGQFILSLSATPISLKTFSVESLSLNNLVDSTGLVSQIVSIEHDEQLSFSNAKLIFDYSNVDLGDTDPESLTFLYLNEETGELEVIPSQVDKVNQLVIAEPTHFSYYVVGQAARASASYSYTNTITLEYDGESIQAREVVATGFDVTKHGFAFHNFQTASIGGFCYGFSFTTYLNYVGKLPISGKSYSNLLVNGPAYDLSEEKRFYAEELYDPSESNLFTSAQNYMFDNTTDASKLQVLCSIIHWYGKQHNVRDKMFDNLTKSDVLQTMKNRLRNDEPVLLSLWGDRGGHNVLICGLYQDVDDQDYYIAVYDSNSPGIMRYVKMTTQSGWLGESIDLEYSNYKSFQLSNFTIPDGPYVPHQFTVTGKVLSFNGAGIPGATVKISDGEDFEKSVTTNSAGNFTIANVPNGEYQIEIEADGFENASIDYASVSGKDVVLAPVSLAMIYEESDICGVVTIADDDTDMTNNLPLQGACVSIELTGYMSKEAYTGTNGEYSLLGIPVGTYKITVSKDGYIPVTETIHVSENDAEVIFNIAIEAISEEHSGVGYASGQIFDVGTGRPVSGLTLYIRNGLENTTGSAIATIHMNSNTTYSTTFGLEAGNYTIQIVDERTGISEEDRYVTSHFNIKILGGMTIDNQNGYVSNGLVSEELRVVLTWGATPDDLDSHMVGPDGAGGKFHEYYPVCGDGSDTDLDVDDISSYGPETITIYQEHDGTYVYAVHDYTNNSASSSTVLSNSGAQVNVYRDNQLIMTYNVPRNQGGTLWTVFAYDSRTRKLTTINEMSYDASYGDGVLMTAEVRGPGQSELGYDEYISIMVADIFSNTKDKD